RLEALHVGHHDRLELAEIVAVLGVELCLGQPVELRTLALGAEVLHVDEEQRRMGNLDRQVAGRGMALGGRHVSSRMGWGWCEDGAGERWRQASGRTRASRSAQACWPAGSAIRSWRISISTWGRWRCSPCTGME